MVVDRPHLGGCHEGRTSVERELLRALLLQRLLLRPLGVWIVEEVRKEGRLLLLLLLRPLPNPMLWLIRVVFVLGRGAAFGTTYGFGACSVGE